MKRYVSLIAVSALALVAIRAATQDYPNRPIHIYVSYTAGSGADTLARYFAEELHKLTGQSMVVENRPGAGGNIGSYALAKAPADGYHLTITPIAPFTGNFLLYRDLPFTINDFAPVTTIGWIPFALVVRTNSPFKSVADLTDYVRGKGGRATYGAPSSASIAIAELYLDETGAKATRVPYKSAADALSDVEAGALDFMFVDLTGALGAVRRGNVRLLAVTSDKRSTSVPDVATLQEAGIKNCDWTAPFVSFMPAKTPLAIVDKIELMLNEVVTRPATRDYLQRFGGEPFPGTTEILRKLLAQHREKWRRAIGLAKIEPM